MSRIWIYDVCSGGGGGGGGGSGCGSAGIKLTIIVEDPLAKQLTNCIRKWVTKIGNFKKNYGLTFKLVFFLV